MKKAKRPIEVTLLPIVTLVRLLQSENADSPIEVTSLPIMMLENREPSNVWAGILQFMIHSPMQALKAFSPIDLTLLGIVMRTKFLHELKAYVPIDVTLFPIVICENFDSAKHPILFETSIPASGILQFIMHSPEQPIHVLT